MQVSKVIIKQAKNRVGWFCKKREYFETKLKENSAKPKDLWKTLKSLGLSKKFSVVQKNAIEENKQIEICSSNFCKVLF